MAVVLSLPRPASAHTPGLSTADFDVEADGTVKARFSFASAEPQLPTTPEDLRAFLLDGVDVTADGSRCTPSFRDAGPSEGDGLMLEASYACPAGAGEARAVAVTLYYLSALPRGHREVARITAGSATTEAVLTGERRMLTLELPASGPRSVRASRARHERLGKRLAAVTAAFTAVMLGLFVWRWRATRRPSRRS